MSAFARLAAGLVGTPFVTGGRDPETGLDCWGLVRCMLERAHGLELPRYALDGSPELAHAAAARIEAEARGWQAVPDGREQPSDVVVLRADGLPLHLGLVLGGGLMLHADQTAGQVAVEGYRGLRWRSRLVGFWRHPAL